MTRTTSMYSRYHVNPTSVIRAGTSTSQYRNCTGPKW
jgi:hypothetical protein